MSDNYIEETKRLRKEKKLHTVIENRLIHLLKKIYPVAAIVPEVHAVLGGRNDVIMFAFNARKVVFELFATASQVPQDLRLLEQCNADVKIAIILDQDIDNKVSSEYFHKKPESFPFIWTKQILDEIWEQYTIARLKELTDEKSSIVRLRKLIEGKYGSSIDEVIRNVIERIESQIKDKNTPNVNNLTGKQVIAFQIIALLKKMGLPNERIRSLYQYLLLNLNFAVLIIISGFQAFLITDLDSRHAIWSDGDLADDLIIMSSTKPEAQVVIFLNPIINKFFKATGLRESKIKYHFFHTYREFMTIKKNNDKGLSKSRKTKKR